MSASNGSPANSPALSPRRRRRIFRAHQLRRRGASIRDIARQLSVAPSTIHSDLHTLEQHWPVIVRRTTRDTLFAELADIQDDIARYRSVKPKDLDQQRLQLTELRSLRRELRLTVAALERLQTSDGCSEDAPVDYPDHELADELVGELVGELVEHSRTPPNNTEHPQPSRPDTDLASERATEEISEQHLPRHERRRRERLVRKQKRKRPGRGPP